jgi:hypothetical protein
MKQKYEIYLRESSITINNHLKPIEIVECEYMTYDGSCITFGVTEVTTFQDPQSSHVEQFKKSSTVAAYNWDDVIKIVKLS